MSPLRRFFSVLCAVALVALGATGLYLYSRGVLIRGLPFGASAMLAVGVYLIWNDGILGRD